jgi:putative GTP pyrophosphokinase
MNQKPLDLPEARATYDRNRRAYHAALRAFHGRVRTLLTREGLHPLITYRVKEFDSYVGKLARLRKSQPHGRILVRDLLGLRVVCPFLDESERVQKLLVDHLPVTEVEHKGSNLSLAEFGYESVHLLVRLPKRPPFTLLPDTKRLCEIQISTILQDAWARIEHELVYKADRSVPKAAIRRKLAALSATLTLADVVFQETRDDLTELHDQGARRRASAQSFVFDDATEPFAASPQELSRLARRQRTLRDPKSRDLENLIVEALQAHSAGNLQEAIRLYSHALHLRLPSGAIRSMIYNHRGIAHLTLSQPDRAMRDFASAVRWNPENFRAYFNRGLGYRALGKPVLALREFRRAVDSQEVEASAHYAMAQVLVELGRPEEARRECDRALALKPKLRGPKVLRERLQTRQ